MATPQPNVRKVGSLAALKRQLKKSSGQGMIVYIPKSGSKTVRFLTELDEFRIYDECWSDIKRTSFPFVEGLVEGVDYTRKSTVGLANAVDTETDKVIALQLKTSVLNSLVIKFEKYGTLMDRDYEIARYGEGLDTTYDVTPESPAKRNLGKYTVLDLDAVVVQAYESAMGDDDDSASNNKRAASSTRLRPRKRLHRGVPQEPEGPSSAEMRAMDWKDLRAYAQEVGVKNGSKVRSTLITEIVEAREEAF